MGRFGTGRGTIPEVLDGSGDPLGGMGRVWGLTHRLWTGRGLSWRSRTGRRTPREVRDGSVDPWGDLGGVEGPLGWSGTGRRKLVEIQDG